MHARLPRSWCALCLIAALAGCRSGVSVLSLPEDGGVVPQGAPVGLRLDGVSSSQPLDVGAVVALRAFAVYQDGSESDETARASFASSDPKVAAIAGTQLRAVARGACDVSAALAADGGRQLSATVTVTVQNPGADATVAVEVAPAKLSLAPGVGSQLAANATQADGSQRSVTALAAWTSSDAAVCTVDDAARKGFVRALKAGACVVQATYGGKSGSAQVVVEALTVTALVIAPAALVVPKGATGQLTATATLSDGSAADVTRTAAWSVADATVATVAAGLVTGVAAGATTITASLGGQSATAAIKVDAAPLLSVSISPPQLTLSAGLTGAARATAVFGDGATQDVTLQAAWSTDSAAVATVSTGGADSGTVLGVAPGRTLLKAAWGGMAGSAVVTVSDAALQVLQLVPGSITLSAGATQRVRAFGTYSDHSVRDVSANVAWAVADGSVATVDGGGNVAALAKGVTKLTASLGGQTAVAVLTVTDALLSKILLLPVSVVVPVGLTQRVIATGVYSDNTLHDVTEQATWAAANPKVADVSNAAGQRGTVVGITAGDTTVTAALGGVTSGPSTVTVTGAALRSVFLQPAQLLTAVYLTLPVRLTARYSDGSEFDQTAASVFTVDNPAVASVVASGASAGQITGIAQGRTTVKGSFGGMSATASVTVVAAVLQAITVTAPRDNIKVGDSEQLRCLAHYQGAPLGIDVTPLCTWTSSNPSAARFLALPPGLLTAQAPGDLVAAAELDGVSGTRAIHVDAVTPLKIDVIQSVVSLPAGVTRALIAIGTYADGSQVDLTLGADWSSDDNQVVVVGNGGLLKGLITGVSPGSAHVTAALSGVSGQSAVTVTDARPLSLSIAPVNPVVTSPGGPFQPTRNFPFYATARFDDGSDQNVTEAASWTTSDPSVVSIRNTPGQKGRADILAPGGATVTATFKGLTASTFLTSR